MSLIFFISLHLNTIKIQGIEDATVKLLNVSVCLNAKHICMKSLKYFTVSCWFNEPTARPYLAHSRSSEILKTLAAFQLLSSFHHKYTIYVKDVSFENSGNSIPLAKPPHFTCWHIFRETCTVHGEHSHRNVWNEVTGVICFPHPEHNNKNEAVLWSSVLPG